MHRHTHLTIFEEYFNKEIPELKLNRNDTHLWIACHSIMGSLYLKRQQELDNLEQSIQNMEGKNKKVSSTPSLCFTVPIETVLEE
jgi:hypothetical protein